MDEVCTDAILLMERGGELDRGHPAAMNAGAFVYILRCADGSYYVGSTVDLERRIWQHNEGLGAAYTRRRGRRPVELVWSGECAHIGAAFALEKQIQGWSRAKREALIRGDFELLPGLARKDFGGCSGAWPALERPEDVG